MIFAPTVTRVIIRNNDLVSKKAVEIWLSGTCSIVDDTILNAQISYWKKKMYVLPRFLSFFLPVCVKFTSNLSVLPLQSSCGHWGTTTGIWSRAWTLAETVRRLRCVSAGTQNAPYGSTWWPAAGPPSPMTWAGQQIAALVWMTLTMPT